MVTVVSLVTETLGAGQWDRLEDWSLLFLEKPIPIASYLKTCVFITVMTTEQHKVQCKWKVVIWGKPWPNG